MFAGDYTFVRIDFPGSILTFANGINARGDIVGRYDDASGRTHGFLLSKGVFSTLDFPGAAYTAPRAINARGDITGRMQRADQNDHGFLLRDGKFTEIDFPNAITTTPRGINNAGDITGNFGSCTDCESGFIFRDGVFHEVHIPGGFTSDIWLAQDNGRVMVGDAAMKPDDALHGFIRYKPRDFQLIDFPGLAVPCTSPRWINERGDIVGLFAVITTPEDCYSGPPTHGFLLRQGRYVRLDFPGAASTAVVSINDDGWIVGMYDDKKGNTHGFKAVPNEP
jgi:probable HAF family extracellular repeat protein